MDRATVYVVEQAGDFWAVYRTYGVLRDLVNQYKTEEAATRVAESLNDVACLEWGVIR